MKQFVKGYRGVCWNADPLYQIRVKTDINSIWCKTMHETQDLNEANEVFDKYASRPNNKYVSLCTRNTGEADGYTCGGNGYATLRTHYN